jgi:hypothetical protein
MDFFYIIVRIQETKHTSNSPCAELYLLLYIKSSSPTTGKFLTHSHQETQDYKFTTSSTGSGSGINFYSQIHKRFILPVPVIMPANPGTTYTITHWQCCSCLRADTDPVYGAGGRRSRLSNQCQYNRILAPWESENPESFDWGENAYINPDSNFDICSKCGHKRCARNCRNASEIPGRRGSVTYQPLGLCLQKPEETYNSNTGTETDASQSQN